MADLTKSMDGIKASEQREALDKTARSASKPLDYGDGENSITRIYGTGTRFDVDDPNPVLESFDGLLDYSEDEWRRADESTDPELSRDELKAKLEDLKESNDYKEFRRVLNVEAVRRGCSAGELQEIRKAFVPLIPNDANSHRTLDHITDLLFTGELEKKLK